MENPQDTNENIPIMNINQSINDPENTTFSCRIVALILIANICAAGIFSGLSFHALSNQPIYSGLLSPFLPIHSAEIQYSRLPHQYWEHRILMIKALGLNTVSLYVMWNHHEIQKGIFDFSTDNKNLNTFLQLLQKHQLKVIIRPGPYVCAQWDFGGLPARLLGVDGLQIRSANNLYESEVKVYFSALAPIIKPYLSSQGGNIIMLQIQNQYGYFSSNNQHLLNLKQMWIDLGIQCQFYIEDSGAFWKYSNDRNMHIGISQTSFLLRYINIQLSPDRSENSLIFGGEVYSGWFTEWGWNWGGVDTDTITYSIQTLLQYDKSFSLYMIFGGTNFGVSAGANGYNGIYQYLPHITSYDYDSPITEQGRVTQKYNSIRSVLQNYYKNTTLPQIPGPLPTIKIDPVIPKVQAYLWANLPEPILKNSQLTFFQSKHLKMYNQGIVIYETFLPQPKNYIFAVTFRDFAIIYLDEQIKTSLIRRKKETEVVEISCESQSGCSLKILVEAMGHINFGYSQTQDKKGLICFEEIGQHSTYLWNIYSIPVHDNSFASWKQQNSTLTFPIVYKAEVNLTDLGDTYFDMQYYKKGYVSVNGHLLGRYWNIGPQNRLFCPAVWLNKGSNTITILELLDSRPQTITGEETLKD